MRYSPMTEGLQGVCKNVVAALIWGNEPKTLRQLRAMKGELFLGEWMPSKANERMSPEKGT